ncbi:ABC transporter substrate-binding protein [Caldanaerobius fijiensis]|nr:ABC transporter substrate-binding protein [Caldanaerobius fijiensis]
MKVKRLVSYFVALLMIISIVLTGCGSKSTSTSNNTKKNAPKSTSSSGPQVNKKKVFRFAGVGWWPKPPLYQGNPFANGGIGAPPVFVMPEGLFKFVRVTDELINQLAESYEQKGNETIVHIRKNVKWNDGQPFTSKDVWAYYMLNNGAFILRYLTGIDTPDDYTVVFKWATPAPEDRLKILLIAQDQQAQIPYHIYGKYVDKAAELLKKGQPTNDPNKKGAFGLYYDKNVSDEIAKNWQDFLKENPKLPIMTGPYMVKTVTASDMVMVKNPYYWDKSKQKFDMITAKQTDASGSLAMLKTGQIDWADFTPAKDILDSILAGNKDLVHYQVPDPADPGFVYNIQKPPFNDVNVRKAIVYTLDREKIKDVGNYFGKVGDVSLTGMPLNMVEKWVPQDIRDKMTKYTYDPAKAEELLKAAGWTKGSDGKWRDKNGKLYNFVIGVASGAPFANAAEVAAEQMSKFGLPTKLMSVDPSLYYTNAQKPKNAYDMSVEFIDVSWGFNHPWWPLSAFYWGFPSQAGNFPTVEDEKSPDYGKLKMVLPGPDGKAVDIDQTIKQMFYMSDEEVRRAAGNIVWITNENAFGVDFYQNVTGFWINAKMIKNIPFEDQIQKYNRNMPLPTSEEDIKTICRYHFGVYGLYAGFYEPR